MAKTLADMEIREDEARPHLVIDISKWAGVDEDGKPQTITLREPDAPALHRVREAAELLKIENPDWPDTLCQAVALLAESHVAPDAGGIPIARFYARIAGAARPVLFSHLIGSFQKAYPAITDFEAAKEEAAKN